MEATVDEDNVVLKTAADVTAVSSCVPGMERCMKKEVLSAIQRDLTAADIRWSLFVAACQSYKQDSCLRPFPPMFLVDGTKDFSALMEAIETVPPFVQLESSIHTLLKKTLMLLHWLLVELKDPSLTVVHKSKMSEVMSLVPCEMAVPPPTLILRVGPRPGSSAEGRWAELQQDYGSVHAFHGSRVENFHSILQHGLQQYMTKQALFGQGVYLSSELLICLPYSRTGLGWTHSVLGSVLSVVVLCEILDHPTVSCQTTGDEAKSRARPEDSLAGEVPHKVYVVPNSDLLRLRYLLVYKAQPSLLAQQQLNRPGSSCLSWLSSNKMTISLVIYVIMLASIGLSRSDTFKRYWQKLCHMLGFHF
ncbi:protein mono-ADP-ribosyltransferase PARP16 isoform X1 [Homalodisca vitripennis]|uniref:protein mono-ADP-ribosyltransferase PARP16 isoform X1 n=1 Tax=Homalodisca vitripennis TaxID=197043 RepID=UPI001EECB99B|nr:protein mono-ADP-ribosyltransferase PARP16 isoform X1 [Homalodisca vitripennis]